MTTQGERIARVEERVENLEKTMHRVEDKLDELLAIRYKGAGAFWLASILFGTSIMGAFFTFMNWWRN